MGCDHRCKHLEGEEKEESHHKTEETHGFGEGKAENGVGEKLLLERGVAGIADDQAAEDRSNTGSRASHADGSSAGTDELGSRVDISSDQGGVQTARLLEGGDLVSGGSWSGNADAGQGASRCSAKELLGNTGKKETLLAPAR